MRNFDHRSFSKGRVPMRPFRNRQLKNALFRSPLQSSAILSLMPIGGGFYGGNRHQAKSSARSSEQALRGIGTFLASIHGTAFHTETHDVKEFLLCERPIHRQDDARRDLLHKMTSLDQTAVRIAPTASNGEPMLHDHCHQFGVDLTV